MIQYLDKLNLTTGERRLVVFVGLFVFILLNVWFVKPHFGDWTKARKELEKNRASIQVYKKEIVKTTEYETQKVQLEGQGGGVLPEEQALHFQREVEDQRRISGLNLISYSAQPNRPGNIKATNTFFENQFLTMVVKTGEPELINFLYNLGSGNSLIRVESMTISPDQTKYTLNATITLMASYQKKPKPLAQVAPAMTANTNPPPASKIQKMKVPQPIVKTNMPTLKTNSTMRKLSTKN
jgi:hypothetical protein